MTLFGCASNKDLGDEEIATPESVVLAYTQGFANLEFQEIENMFEESAAIGDVYFIDSQAPPKDRLDMIKSQNLFITHFYGDDAWEDVVYDIIPNSDGENETDGIEEYSVNFIFNDMPLHLLGFENLHITLSNESGQWMIKEGLSWEVNLYGGQPAPNYFQGSEASYRTIDRDHKPEDVMYVLGNTMNREETENDGYYTFDLKYGDAIFYFFAFADENGQLDDNYTLDGIMVQSGDYDMFRGIKIGDSFYDTMSKFPRERDWTLDPDNVFYGNGTMSHDENLFGGTCNSWVEEDGTKRASINLKDKDCVATVNFQFYDEILKSMEMYYISYL